jgi:hypothetical protein
MYIKNARMNQRSFYIKLRIKCPVGLPRDRWFVFATTYVLREGQSGFFGRNEGFEK